MNSAVGVDVAAVAAELKSAQDRVAQVAPFSARIPGFDVAAGYEVAHRVHLARLAEGARALGRKIGFTNAALWPQYGVRTPIWGYMYDTSVALLDDVRVRFSLARLAEPRIEPEIAFGLRTAPRPGASLAEIAAAVEWVAHAFEIVQTHFPGWKFKAADTIADQGLHGALLVGPRIPLAGLGGDPVEILESLAIDLARDGVRVDSGTGANVLGSPLKAMAHLLAVLDAPPRHAPLATGEIVTTGTVTLAHPVAPGETWSTQVRGAALPGLTVAFEA